MSLNIVYYLVNFPKLSESFILNEIHELESRGHTVAVFALNELDEDVTHAEYPTLNCSVDYATDLSKTDIFTLASPTVLHSKPLSNGYLGKGIRSQIIDVLRAKECIEAIHEIGMDVDLVHSHFAVAWTYPASYVASYYEVPLTVTTHAHDLFETNLDQHLAERMVSRADHVFTISHYNARYIRENIAPCKPISVVRAGIRPEKFQPSGEIVENRVFSVCRLVETKGLQYAIRAISSVVERLPGVTYHIAGTGPLEEELQDLITQLDIEENVKLLGDISDEQLIDEFAAAQCFLLPCVIADSGNRDGIPVALMEAMAMETPPVSTRISGIPELIDDGTNGFLVEPENPRKTADAILRLLTDEDMRLDLGATARATVEAEFDIKDQVTKLEHRFRALTDN